jgi:outer membrane protein assembly factor BamB
MTLSFGIITTNGLAKDTDWHGWRGPANTGVGQADRIPDTWNDAVNLKWKAAVPGQGHATPTITGDRVIVLTALPIDEQGDPIAITRPAPRPDGERREGRRGGRPRGEKPKHVQRFLVMCLDRTTGNVRWEKTATEKLPHEGFHDRYGSYASASPVIDGERIYASFGSFGFYCYDLDGNLIWKRDLVTMRTRNSFGEGGSPTLHGDLVVIAYDHEGDSVLVALDKNTGETKWKTPRPTRSAWSTPVVVDVAGKPQVVVNGDPAVRGYDLASGKELWHCDGMTANVIPAIVHGHELIYAVSGFRGAALRAIRLGKTGDLTGDAEAIAWRLDRGTPYVTSPLLYGDELYLLEDRGLLSCLDARTGKENYRRERVPGVSNPRFHASPVGAGDKIYLASEGGDCVVLKRGKKLELIGVNTMDDSFSASPADAGGDLFLRGRSHLYCIGEK